MEDKVANLIGNIMEEENTSATASSMDYEEEYWEDFEEFFMKEDTAIEALITENSLDAELSELAHMTQEQDQEQRALAIGLDLFNDDQNIDNLHSIFEYENVSTSRINKESHQNNYFSSLAQRMYTSMSKQDIDLFSSRRFIRRNDEVYCSTMESEFPRAASRTVQFYNE